MEIKALPAQNENEKKHFNALMFGDGAEDEDLGDDSSTDDDRTNSGNVPSAVQSGDTEQRAAIQSLTAVPLDENVGTQMTESKVDSAVSMESNSKQPINVDDGKNKGSSSTSMDVDSGSESSSAEEEEKPLTAEELKVQKLMEERREMYAIQATNDRATLDILRSLEHI